jgi:hypothetical protein
MGSTGVREVPEDLASRHDDSTRSTTPFGKLQTISASSILAVNAKAPKNSLMPV